MTEVFILAYLARLCPVIPGWIARSRPIFDPGNRRGEPTHRCTNLIFHIPGRDTCRLPIYFLAGSEAQHNARRAGPEIQGSGRHVLVFDADDSGWICCLHRHRREILRCGRLGMRVARLHRTMRATRVCCFYTWACTLRSTPLQVRRLERRWVGRAFPSFPIYENPHAGRGPLISDTAECDHAATAGEQSLCLHLVLFLLYHCKVGAFRVKIG